MTASYDVVALTAEDWRRWRALRLRAPAEAPYAFGSTLAEWTGSGDTEERWRSRCRAVPDNFIATTGHVDRTDVAMVSLARPVDDGRRAPLG